MKRWLFVILKAVPLILCLATAIFGLYGERHPATGSLFRIAIGSETGLVGTRMNTGLFFSCFRPVEPPIEKRQTHVYVRPRTEVKWNGLEFIYGSTVTERQYDQDRSVPPGYMVRMMFPYWSIIAAGLLPLGLWGILFIVRRRGFPEGHCPTCGYDLRASPERCPECGTVATTEART